MGKVGSLLYEFDSPTSNTYRTWNLSRMLTGLWVLAWLLCGDWCLAQSEAYLSPCALAVDAKANRVYIAAATGAQVLVLDAPSRQVIQTIPVAPHPRAMVLSSDGSELYVTSAVPAGEILIVNTRTSKIRARVPVGHTPAAVALNPNGRTLYVGNQFDNTVSVVDLQTRKCIHTVPVLREPVGMAMTWAGDALFVINRLPVGAANGPYLACAVSVIDTATSQVTHTIELPDGATNALGISISPDDQYAYVTHVMARYQFPVTALEKGWVNTNALSVLQLPERTYVNTVLLDDTKRGAADPYAVACTANGKHLLVTHAGSHELSVIDRAAMHHVLPASQSPRNFVSSVASTGDIVTGQLAAADRIGNKLGFLQGIRRRIELKGKGPRALAVLGSQVYTADYYSDSLSRVNLSQPRSKPVWIPLAYQTPQTPRRQGEMFFHDASDSYQNWHSCATCHGAQARANAHNWDLLNDGVANPKNTKSLFLSHATPPMMATGVRPHMNAAISSGIRYIKWIYPRHGQIEAIATYLRQLEPVPSPHLIQGQLSASARLGETLFTKAGCVGCHTPPHYTNQQKVDVGTGTEEDNDSRYDVPTLSEVWRTAPYLHDGRAAQIVDVLTTYNAAGRHGKASDLSANELNDLVAYVLTR